MPHMRYLFTIVLIGVGCSSSRSQQAAQTEAAFETFNQRCHPPDACDQWSALGYRPGGQAVRFEALSRATSESVFVWLDTVTTPEPGHPRFIPVDSLASKLNARELLAHFCTRKGQTSQEAFIAIVRDTDAVLFYPTPRLAWRFDAGAVRIRPAWPDAVQCQPELEGE